MPSAWSWEMRPMSAAPERGTGEQGSGWPFSFLLLFSPLTASFLKITTMRIRLETPLKDNESVGNEVAARWGSVQWKGVGTRDIYLALIDNAVSGVAAARIMRASLQTHLTWK